MDNSKPAPVCEASWPLDTYWGERAVLDGLLEDIAGSEPVFLYK